VVLPGRGDAILHRLSVGTIAPQLAVPGNLPAVRGNRGAGLLPDSDGLFCLMLIGEEQAEPCSSSCGVTCEAAVQGRGKDCSRRL
jgi:hypothetical protein